jgi:thioredoxin-related protein
VFNTRMADVRLNYAQNVSVNLTENKHLSVLNINLLMLLGEKVCIYCENHAK